ncbi:sucrose-6-phosphate hydrolase [Companilactobacillus zhachilii]|uniref:Sucrose-6-phosphate hydrolase n=1 Tax=Companilactobacillus zhachilii TaxID=2304606 RepID=A0A386PS87_9LACO|nr:sucrose-6-phosphate hydrolase [Companilactobacillus zhachilii]AYE38866.1 sucrose-6-phosphate hydrolase [Companilactobacillus zhachilii]
MITKWTRNLRYLPYKNWSDNQITAIKQKISQSHWRLGYHIQPTTGLLNDPNGFSYFNNQWHLFYQSFPYGPVHGLKNWTHLTSDDLVHWQDHGPLVIPGDKQDSHGAYSGSAIPVGDDLFLMYTGNVRDSKWVRHPKQDGAWMDANNQLKKIATPLIGKPKDGFTEHFRDPQVIYHGKQYYCLIGARKADNTGHILVYQADKVTGPWKYKTELKFTNQTMGYMIECPNLVFIGSRPVLIFCPQGIDQSVLSHRNIYPNAYVIGQSFDWNNFEIIQPSSIENLDDGFDAYATQAFKAPDGRVLSVSWIGLPDTTYPTDSEGWANCYSLVKELKIENNKLYQYPVVENDCLGKNKISTQGISAQTKLSWKVSTDTVGIVCIKTELGEKLQIVMDSTNGKILVDRTNSGVSVSKDFGTIRSSDVVSHKDITADLWFDNTVFELYINHGERVLTGRIFPNGRQFYVDSKNVNVCKMRLDKIY